MDFKIRLSFIFVLFQQTYTDCQNIHTNSFFTHYEFQCQTQVSQMNYIDRTMQQPNYIFNFNIDIPIKYKSTFTHRSNPASPSKSPGKLNQKKYKLSSITPRPVGLAINTLNSKKLDKQKNITKSNRKNCKVPKTMKQEFLEKDLYQISNNIGVYNNEKKQQGSISRKTEKIVSNKKLKQKQQICPSRRTVKNNSNIHQNGNNSQVIAVGKKNVVRNISILQKLVTDDNNIKYTTDSSEVIRQTEPNQVFPSNTVSINSLVFKFANNSKNLKDTYGKSQIVPTLNDQINLAQMREYEQLATQRKQKLNYEYLKEKILIESSVKKIQRAWRGYLTKKLVNSYSTTIASKFTNNQLISSARSQPRGISFLKAKKPFKSNDLYMVSQMRKIHQSKTSQYDEIQSQNQSEKNLSLSSEKQFRPFTKKPSHVTGKVQSNFFKSDNSNKVLLQSNFIEKQKINTLNDATSEKQSTPSIKSKQSNEQKREKELFPSFNISKSKDLSSSRERQVQEKLKRFQQQQIRKWQSILESIKKGKSVDILLKQSQNFKKELQSNIKLISNLQTLNTINRNRASPIIFQTPTDIKRDLNLSGISSASLSSKNLNINIQAYHDPENTSQIDKIPIKNKQCISNIRQLSISKQQSQSVEQPIEGNTKSAQLPSITKNKKQLQQQKFSIKQQQLNETAQKRKEKIIFFQNQILKIDNQEYSDMSSVSCQSFNQVYHQINISQNKKNDNFNDLEQKEREENIKLRKKLELFNTHFLDISSEQGLTDRSLKGLKGNSTDERRNNIRNKLGQTNVKTENQYGERSPEQPSSEENRKYQRADVVLSEEQLQNERKLSKIQDLINRQIQYPQESSQDSDLCNENSNEEVDNEEFQNRFLQRKDHYMEQSDESSIELDQHEIDFSQKHINNDFLYGEPVMTHRDRRLQVPQLKLQNLPRNLNNSIKKQLRQDISPQQSLQTELTCKIQECLKTNKKRQQIQQSFNLLKVQHAQLKTKVKQIPKADMKDVLKVCSYLQEELIYEGLLEFSDSDRIVQSIKSVFETFKKQKKKIKPQGICTNLQSIKDYLQNFVGYIFENKLSGDIERMLWTSAGPKAKDLLRYLRKDSSHYQSQQNQYIMSIDVFQKHWKYANANIYFDKKYNDQKTEIQRVNYLKGLTRVYFRSIFDAFNESLEFQRSYGLTGEPYPWSKKSTRQARKSLKTGFQHAYRRILKMSVVYYGVHFDDKSHIFNEETIKQLQQQRLLTLLMMELEQDEYKWNFIEDQSAEAKYDISIDVEQLVLQQFLSQFKEIQSKRQGL